MADEFDQLSPEDRSKLEGLEVEYRRDGRVAFDRFAEKEPVAYFRILAALEPKQVRAALEDALIEAGLTNADVRALAEKAKYKH